MAHEEQAVPAGRLELHGSAQVQRDRSGVQIRTVQQPQRSPLLHQKLPILTAGRPKSTGTQTGLRKSPLESRPVRGSPQPVRPVRRTMRPSPQSRTNERASAGVAQEGHRAQDTQRAG
uniref:(northern house mosquito) hypothetical protein n=1 Tax=Culex pipiens TaxID=7175 RepID=A0A8D8KJC7_CULPI